ncbi:MAG: sialate O-acetylesterase, partial [Kiritimatiellae bacterium]|nr:sialate O-acetylesterase [Kiritimatiellia bacterium]
MGRIFRARIMWGAVLALVLAGRAWAEETAPMRLFLLIGQSNMAGRGAVGESDQESDPRILMLTRENTWVPARDPVHFDKPKLAGVGLCSSFARAYLRDHAGERVGLIPCAFGGTSLEQWMPGKPLYTTVVARARAAMADGTLAGILWHQGEADCAEAKRERYEGRFREMIARLREDLDARTVPLVVGELGRFHGHGSDAFKGMLGKAARRIPLCALATSEELTD